jgi:hypothetical protein
MTTEDPSTPRERFTADAQRALDDHMAAEARDRAARRARPATPRYTTAAVAAITEASRAEHDLSGWLAAVLVEVRRARGGWAAMEDRPGSWEAAHVLALVEGTEPERGW